MSADDGMKPGEKKLKAKAEVEGLAGLKALEDDNKPIRSLPTVEQSLREKYERLVLDLFRNQVGFIAVLEGAHHGIAAAGINRRACEGREPPGPRRAILASEAVAYEDAAQTLRTALDSIGLTDGQRPSEQETIDRFTPKPRPGEEEVDNA